MSDRLRVLFVLPQWDAAARSSLAAHHEATSGMGGFSVGPKHFLYPPHTMAQCAAVTRAAGLETDACDIWGESGGQPSVAALLDRVASSGADVLGVQVSHGTAAVDETFLRLLRWRAAGRPIRVLLFGPSAHLVAEPWLRAGLADAALLGEPEGAIAEAVAALAGGRLAGATWAAELAAGRYEGSQPPGSALLTCRALDALPFPAWDLAREKGGRAWASLIGSRGCPAGCRYCGYAAVQGCRTRSQSVERTLAEWVWLARDVQPRYLLVRDPVFAHDRVRVQALCEGLVRERIALRWGCESRPEHFDGELLRLMKEAGCEDVKIGLESGDPALLSALGRLPARESARSYLAQARRVAAACRELDIACRVFVMAGLPGQDAGSLAATAAALRRLGPGVFVHVMPYQAYPGVLLAGPASPAPPEVVSALQEAVQPAWRRWSRAWGGSLRRLLADRRDRVAQPAAPAERAAGGRRVLRDLGPLAGQRAFVTGANGFVGGHVARALIDAGAGVVALVRPGSPLGALADARPGAVEIVRGDLVESRPDWAEALRGCGYCFHVAALYAGADRAEEMYAVNVRGTNALLSACAAADVGRVVYTGTIGTVGRPANPASLPDEDTPFNLWHQASHYVRSKYLGELVALTWQAAGLAVVVVKPTAPVGAGDARPTATGARIRAALRGRATPYPPGGVNHVPVVDVAAGHLLAALYGVPGRTYILGHVQGNLGRDAFLRMVRGTRADEGRRTKNEGRAVAALRGQMPVSLTADPSRAIRELGLPQSDLQAAFAEAVAWFERQAG